MIRILLILMGLFFFESCKECYNQKFYNNEGILEYEGEICGEKKNGAIKTYFDTGLLESETNWNFGIQNGLATLFHPNGNLYIKYVFENGIPHGDYIRLDSLGFVLKKGKFINGNFFGKEYFYNEDFEIEEIDILENDTIVYSLVIKNSTSKAIKVISQNERYMISCEYDTLNRTLSNSDFKFAVNHTISDSIRLINGQIIVFKWPEDSSTSYQINLQDYKSKEFIAVFYMRADLPNKEYAGKVFRYDFTLPLLQDIIFKVDK